MSFNSTIPKINKKLENILIIGGGGRENALGWAIQKNELIKKIYISPGNAGSEKIKKCIRIDLDTTNKKDIITNSTKAKTVGEYLCAIHAIQLMTLFHR